MSHATYSFLLSLEDEHNPKEEAISVFESFAADRCDDNNWFQEEALVLIDGQTFCMCPEDDYRGRNILYQEILKVPQEERWNWSRKFALDCVVLDMGVFGACSISLGGADEYYEQIKSISFDELVAHILQEIPNKISDAYREIIGKGLPNSFDMDEYRRRKLVKNFEAFRNCGYDNSVPFTVEYLTPYDYRAFNLTCEEPANAILFVDIHT